MIQGLNFTVKIAEGRATGDTTAQNSRIQTGGSDAEHVVKRAITEGPALSQGRTILKEGSQGTIGVEYVGLPAIIVGHAPK